MNYIVTLRNYYLVVTGPYGYPGWVPDMQHATVLSLAAAYAWVGALTSHDGSDRPDVLQV